MMNEQWFKLTIQQIEKKLKTNAALGLSRKAARSRVNKNSGSVFIFPKESPMQMLGDLVADFSWILLVFAAGISSFFVDNQTGIVVFVLLSFNLLISFLVYHKSIRTSEQLNAFFYPKARFIRGGRLFYGDARKLVPGDVILIEQGDILCCDARLINSDHLSVKMRLDREHYTDLNKYAEGFLSPQIHHPKDMTNMVHAGSIVTQGNARAIVTEVGNYTYLGAMTKGISFPCSKKLPKSLQELRKKCAKWNTLLLLSVLPLCILSLFFGHFFGGTVLLSTAFLTYMSVVATGVSHMVCMIAIYFYTKQAYRLLHTKNPIAIRSLAAFDQLSDLDYLFVRDSAAFTDGIMHYDSVFCTHAIPRKDTKLPAYATYFADMAALYYMASTEAPTLGFQHSSKYSQGISEFLCAYSIDREALRIRCKIVSYLPGNLTTEDEKLCIEDQGKKLWFSVSTSLHTVYTCATLYGANGQRGWNNGERDAVISYYRRMIANHRIPLIFRLISENGTSHDDCLLGIIFLKEGIDEERIRHIDTLEQFGCRVILFSDDNQKPTLPVLASEDRIASKKTLLSHGLPLTYQFGKFRQYVDFQSEDIQLLADYARSRGKSVGLLCFNGQSQDLLNRVDLTLSCTSIQPIQREDFQESIYSETPGNPNSTICTQVVAEQVDILFPRPTQKKGGLPSVITAILLARKANSALTDFLSYMFCAQIMRLIIALIPMLAGKPVIDARHVIFCACIMDLLAFFLFAQKMQDRRPQRASSNQLWIGKDLLAITGICSLLVLIIPNIMERIGIFGAYLYPTEFAFTSMIALQFTMLVFMLYPSFKEFQNVFKNYSLIAAFLALSLFILSCYIIFGFGALFSIEKNPFPYMLASFIPACIFAIAEIFRRIRKKLRKKHFE